MPLTIYRRHTEKCKHSTRAKSRCSCPLWVQGVTADGRKLKQSLRTRAAAEAQSKVRELDRGRARRIPTVGEAATSFLSDLERRKLSSSVQGKFKRMLARLESKHPAARLDHLTADDMRQFARSWGFAATTERAEIERLRQFWAFCVDSNWIDRNPAKAVKPPKEPRPQVEPFTADEMRAILAVCDATDRAVVLLMRYSGLRIGDVVHLEKSRIDGDRLTLRTTKTGAVVSVPLPPVVLEALVNFPPASERWYFWTGESRQARNSWCNRLKRLFDRSGVQNAHSHRLRHTFAAELLLAGASLESVATLLGHASVKTTERHYAAWVRARQEQLDRQVRAIWEGTNEVQSRAGNNKGGSKTASIQ